MEENKKAPASQIMVLTESEINWRMMKEMAKYALASGFLPKTITKPEQALVIIQKGKELGIQPMDALANIHVINGKATLSAELMLSLFLTRIKGAKIRYLTPSDKTHLACKLEIAMEGADPSQFEFTIEDAKRAGLLNNPSWLKYPAALLRARCVSAAIRAYAPHATSGCYTAEELGHSDIVDGELIEPERKSVA